MKKTDIIINVIPSEMLQKAADKIAHAERSLIANAIKITEKASTVRRDEIRVLIKYALDNNVPRKIARDDIVEKVLMPAISSNGADIPGALTKKTVQQYGTSIMRAIELGVEYRHNLANDPQYARKKKPKVETPADEESLEVGEGLAQGKREAKKPGAPKVATRWEVSHHASVTVGMLRAVGEMECADAVQEILEDYNLWALPKTN